MTGRNASLIQRTIALIPASSHPDSIEFAQKLGESIGALLTDKEANEAALLSAIGMARHPSLILLRSRVLRDGKDLLSQVEDHFKRHRFADPESKKPTSADALLVWHVREVVDFVLETSDRVIEFPSTSRWLEACLRSSSMQFQQALREELTDQGVLDRDIPARIVRGEAREPHGSMIDAKPRYTDARRAADKVKEINKDYKKQQSQRQKEESKKAAEVVVVNVSTPNFCLGERIAFDDVDKIEKCMHMLKRVCPAEAELFPLITHAPAMDATQLDQALASQPGVKCKNLFLRAKKTNSHYLVCVPTHRQVDLAQLKKQLNASDQLRFAAEDVLKALLDVSQGSVTPFCLVNDPDLKVTVVLDQEMMSSSGLLWFHPLSNEASVGISPSALLQFIKQSGREALVLPLGAEATPSSAAVSTPVVEEGKKSVQGANAKRKSTPPKEEESVKKKPVASPAAAADAKPLVLTLTHALAQDRLWARLDKMGLRAKRLEAARSGEEEAARPVGHDTHNLLVKDSKSKQLYLVCLDQSRTVDLKQLGELLKCKGGLRLAGPADVETSIALTKGCVTPLSLFNNVQGNVIPVFDAKLLQQLEKPLVLCAGCDDVHDHVSHNCVSVSIQSMLDLIQEACPREHLVVELD